MSAATIEVQIPKELLQELDATAAAQQRPRDELVAEGVRRVVSDIRWRMIQTEGAKRARAAGIVTDDDVEDLLDSLSDE